MGEGNLPHYPGQECEMADTTKCGHCGSRDTAAGGWHVHCFVCNGFTDAEGSPVAQPSDHDTAA